jgi:PAS domain S-box-containing protein
METRAQPKVAFRNVWSAHKRLLTGAPGAAWVWFFLCWVTLSLLLCMLLLQVVIRRQQEWFQREAAQLCESLETRLKLCELVLDGMGELADSSPAINALLLRKYAGESVQRYSYINSMGYEPMVGQEQRAGFESRNEPTVGTEFHILDYAHDQNNNWSHPEAWHRAARRERYVPLTMAEPPLSGNGENLMGLDLLGDRLFGPTVERALRSSEIEISPALHLQHGISLGYVRAIYSPSPPSSSPLIRPEEATGVVLLLMRIDALVNLSPMQRDLLDVTLARQQGDSSAYDDPIYQSRARRLPGWFDKLLPHFEQRQLVETPYSPYELKIGTQLRCRIFTQSGMLAAILLAILPSYLILLIVTIRHHAQKSQESADDSLYRTREHASVTLHAISDAVITIDNNCKVEYLNPAARQLLGFSEQRALGRALDDVFKLRYEFSRQAVADPLAECLHQRRALDLEENSYLLRPNGEKLLIEGTVSPLFDRVGGLIGCVLTFRDTAPLRRRMLEALEHSEARLRQHESELARVTRITSMGEMASGIAHEINQPLSAIMSYCQASLSLLEDDDLNIALIIKAIESAVAQADRAGKIVHRLREFVAKKAPIHSPVDVNHAVSNALALADYDLQSQQINIEFHPGRHLPLVFADTIQLEQVVLNLVRNASDAMQENSGEGLIRLETRYSDKRVCITVRDNGSGISSDKLDQIFAPFFSTKSHGMGLGLTICQTIVESFGGRISVYNRYSGGAEFMIELPPLDAHQLSQSSEVAV